MTNCQRCGRPVLFVNEGAVHEKALVCIANSLSDIASMLHDIAGQGR